MQDKTVSDEIQSLLNGGRGSGEIIALGYKPGTVYKVQRRFRAAQDPPTGSLETNKHTTSGLGEVSTETAVRPATLEADMLATMSKAIIRADRMEGEVIFLSQRNEELESVNIELSNDKTRLKSEAESTLRGLSARLNEEERRAGTAEEEAQQWRARFEEESRLRSELLRQYQSQYHR